MALTCPSCGSAIPDAAIRSEAARQSNARRKVKGGNPQPKARDWSKAPRCPTCKRTIGTRGHKCGGISC